MTIFCNDWIRIDNKILCALSNANAICMIDEDSGDVEYLHSTDDAIDASNLYSAVVGFENKYFFVPYRAKHILVYSDITKEFHDIDIGIDYDKRRDGIAFWTSYSRGELLYMFGCGVPNYLILNMRTEEIRICFVSGMETITGNKGFFAWGLTYHNGSLYAPFGNESKVLRISLNVQNTEILDIPADITRILSITGENGELAILCLKDDRLKLLIMNPDLRNVEEIEICSMRNDEVNRIFFAPVLNDETAYIFPYSNIDRYYTVDLKERRAYENINFKCEAFESGKIGGLSYVKKINNKICFQERTNGKWGSFDIINQSIRLNGKYKLHSERFLALRNREELKRVFRHENSVEERKGYLSAFIQNITQQ